MTDLLIPRRKFLLGLGASLAAPAIVRVENLMPIPRRPVVAVRLPIIWDLMNEPGPDWLQVLDRAHEYIKTQGLIFSSWKTAPIWAPYKYDRLNQWDSNAP